MSGSCLIISASTKALSRESHPANVFLAQVLIERLERFCLSGSRHKLWHSRLLSRTSWFSGRRKHSVCANGRVERAQYEVDLAQRRYLRVDPDNRLVATVLEAEWNTKLRELEEARATEEQYKQSDQYRVSPEERAEIDGTPERFRQFWENPKTTARQRKRAVRLVIEDVTVHKSDQIVAHIRFKGGATQTITVPLPPPFAQSRLTSPETLAARDCLLEKHTDTEVAAQLNQQGYRTFDGLLFQSIHVYQLRRHHGIPDGYTRLRSQGMLTAEELASKLGVSAQVIWRRYHKGHIIGVRYNDRGSCLFLPPDEEPQARLPKHDSDLRDDVHYAT